MLTLAVICLGLLGITWAVYPAMIAAAARARRQEVAASWSTLPSVTVVLATRAEAATVRSRVADLLAAGYPAELLSLVVALDRRGGLDPDAVGLEDSRVRVVHGDAPGGKTATLNAGVRAAAGRILVFADSDQRFAPDAIGELVGALADPSIGAVSGALDLPGDGGGRRSVAEQYWRYERALRRNEATVHSAVGVSGSIYAMRREQWKPLPADLILDDVYVPMRLVLDGHRVGFCERARATDHRRTQPEQEYRRKVRTLTGNIQLCAWLPQVLNPLRNPIWVQFVCHKLLRLLTPYLLLGVAIGATGALATSLPPRMLGWIALVLAVVLLLATIPPVVRHRLRDLARWGWWLQAAVVVATFHGVRGRWNVWR